MMDRQLSLFDEPVKRKRASGSGPGVPNRNEVYHANKANFTQMETFVLAAIRNLKGATMHEVAAYMGKQVNQISGRFSALANKNAIVADGKRETKTGSMATVWRAK